MFLITEVECQELSSTLIGSSYNGLRIDDGQRTVGSHAVYSCELGFVIIGESKRECLTGGHWDGVEPSCKRTNETLKTICIIIELHGQHQNLFMFSVSGAFKNLCN